MKQLHDGTGVLPEEMDVFGERAFLESAAIELPDLRDEIRESGGLHGAVAQLAEVTRSALAVRDMPRVERILRFLDRAVSQPRAIGEIENAVAISFVSASELRKSTDGAGALDAMPASLQKVLLEQERRECGADKSSQA